MQKRWEISDELKFEDLDKKRLIVEAYKCPEVIAELLIRKGFRDLDSIDEFLNPDLEHTHDPFLFEDMEKAVERVIEAIKRKEKITIYGDYDVDGTTSTALLYLGLKKVHANIDYYIPHRMIDGYGLSLSGVEQLNREGTKLILSVDCGINAIEEVDYINSTKMEIIITDHHNPKEILPNASAIINPKLPGTRYPFVDLAGVGVAYKFLLALYTKLNIDLSQNAHKFLDLVAVGTISDIVPLVGENRIFASAGIKRLKQRKNIGINALIDIAGLSYKDLNTSDIVFGLAPRINAAGRMGSALRAVELMVSDDISKSEELAQIIERENSIRQQIDQRTFQEACEIINKKYKRLEDTYCLVVSSDNWHPGVIGIVASKLVEKYYRPTIMITFNEGIGSGSGRSIANFDIFQALSNVDNLLESFGGHRYAAGLSILTEYIDSFENKINKFAQAHITKEEMVPPLKIDKHLELYEINEHLIEWLNKFAPHGPKNSKPVFYTRDVTVIGYPYNVGRNHIKLKVRKDGCDLDLIGFNLGDFLSLVRKNSCIDVAYSLEFNTWQDKTTIQGSLKDIKIGKNSHFN